MSNRGRRGAKGRGKTEHEPMDDEGLATSNQSVMSESNNSRSSASLNETPQATAPFISRLLAGSPTPKPSSSTASKNKGNTTYRESLALAGVLTCQGFIAGSDIVPDGLNALAAPTPCIPSVLKQKASSFSFGILT